MKKALLAYIPVLHAGYVDFLKKYPHPLYLVDKEIISELSKEKPYYLRDIRAVDSSMMAKMIVALDIVPDVVLLDSQKLADLKKIEEIVAPDEDITRDLVAKYLPGKKINFVNVFLRWDKLISQKELEISPDRIISTDKLHKEFMAMAETEAAKSSDWWRQIGAVIVSGKKMISFSRNRHLPSDQSPNCFGDPRSNFNAGEVDFYTSIHAEADAIAQAAEKGIAVSGASIYSTTFPCSNCAKLLARAGIKKVYYSKGYSQLDAENIFKAFGIEVVLVK